MLAYLFHAQSLIYVLLLSMLTWQGPISWNRPIILELPGPPFIQIDRGAFAGSFLDSKTKHLFSTNFWDTGTYITYTKRRYWYCKAEKCQCLREYLLADGYNHYNSWLPVLSRRFRFLCRKLWPRDASVSWQQCCPQLLVDIVLSPQHCSWPQRRVQCFQPWKTCRQSDIYTNVWYNEQTQENLQGKERKNCLWMRRDEKLSKCGSLPLMSRPVLSCISKSYVCWNGWCHILTLSQVISPLGSLKVNKRSSRV